MPTPTHPGYHWFRWPGNTWRPVEVSTGTAGQLRTTLGGTVGSWTVENAEGQGVEWGARIPWPEERLCRFCQQTDVEHDERGYWQCPVCDSTYPDDEYPKTTEAKTKGE